MKQVHDSLAASLPRQRLLQCQLTPLRLMVISFVLSCGPAAAQVWSSFADDMTYTQNSDNALMRTLAIYQKIPEAMRRTMPFHEKVSVGIGSAVDPSHCQTPFELARTVPRDAVARTSTITFCRRALYFATYNVASMLLLDVMGLQDNTSNSRILDAVVKRNQEIALEDYAQIAAKAPNLKTPCGPIEMIYVVAFMAKSSQCQSLAAMSKPSSSDVERSLWSLLRANASKLGFDAPPNSPSSNLWVIEKWFMQAVGQSLFDLVAAHELGHLAAGDVWRSAQDRLAEQRADTFAMNILSDNTSMGRSSISAQTATLALHVGSVYEAWQGRSPVESLGTRVSHSAKHAACTLMSAGVLQDVRNEQERASIVALRKRIATLPANCEQ